MRLFRDKPIEVTYVEECLLKDRGLEGLDNLDQFLIDALFSTSRQSEMWIGEFIGKECLRQEVADCFWLHFRNRYEPKKTKALENAVSEVHKISNFRILKSLELSGEKRLDFREVFNCAEKTLDILLVMKDPNSVVISELGKSARLRDLRIQVMIEIPGSILIKSFHSRLNDYLGIA